MLKYLIIHLEGASHRFVRLVRHLEILQDQGDLWVIHRYPSIKEWVSPLALGLFSALKQICPHGNKCGSLEKKANRKIIWNLNQVIKIGENECRERRETGKENEKKFDLIISVALYSFPYLLG